MDWNWNLGGLTKPTIRWRWPGPAKRRQITVGPSTINHRIRFCAGPPRRFGIAESHLKPSMQSNQAPQNPVIFTVSKNH